MVITQSNGASSPRPEISLPTNRPGHRQNWSPELDAKLRAKEPSFARIQPRHGLSPAFFPGGDRSLSGIALQAFFLGGTAALAFAFSIGLAYLHNRIWTAPFFVGVLATFHFLEFFITAAYNTPSAFVSSFLLSNGNAYRIAHSIALLEAIATYYFFPDWQLRWYKAPLSGLGIAMVVVGQTVRSFAMKQAGTNFNHRVQSEKNEGHELVTTGLYTYFRHPSYFGFFWWGLGTQVMLGNTVSFVGYAGIMWYFFKTRIQHEEKHLVLFFGDEYTKYRARTPVWIPFVW